MDIIDAEHATTSTEGALRIWDTYFALLKQYDLPHEHLIRERIGILDLGCGQGFQVKALTQESYCAIGVDMFLPSDSPENLIQGDVWDGIQVEKEIFAGRIIVCMSNHLFDPSMYGLQTKNFADLLLNGIMGLVGKDGYYFANEPFAEQASLLGGKMKKVCHVSPFGDRRMIFSPNSELQYSPRYEGW